MIIKSLQDVNLDILLGCFLKAFENYYVEMPTDHKYYKERWKTAKVQFSFSYGMFDKGKLVGFIIHAIDKRNNKLTAFNTGTGVIPEYRGQKIVKRIYEYARKDLEKNGISHSILEVITDNIAAIKSYQSVGFKIYKKYKCFKGELRLGNVDPAVIKEVSFKELDWKTLPNQDLYSWDNHFETIRNGDYKYFLVMGNKAPQSYFVIHPDTGYIPQFELLNTKKSNWFQLFSGINQVSNTIKINNVDTRLVDKIDFLQSIGMVNSINQFEMRLGFGNNDNPKLSR